MRCLAVSILTAFKIQKSVSLEGMQNWRKDSSAFAQMKTETSKSWFEGNIEVKQCICIGMRDLTHIFEQRDTAKLLINRCPTLTN